MKITVDQWVIQDLTLTPEKAKAIWDILQRHATLFSDLTRGDPRNFLRAVTADHTLWFEVRQHDTLVGIIWFSDLHLLTDVSAHMAFFDRMTFEKLPVCKAIIKWMFQNFPIHRMTVTPPDLYTATIRLLRRLGFTHEGTKREAVLLSGKWRDQMIFGITRTEAEGLSNELSNRQNAVA